MLDASPAGVDAMSAQDLRRAKELIGARTLWQQRDYWNPLTTSKMSAQGKRLRGQEEQSDRAIARTEGRGDTREIASGTQQDPSNQGGGSAQKTSIRR